MALNQAQPYRETTFPFVNAGVIGKIDPALLKEGEYQQVLNMDSVQEGALRSRNGYRNLTPTGVGALFTGEPAAIAQVHTIERVASGTQNPTYDIVYLGTGEDVYRVNGSVPLIAVPSVDTGQPYAIRLATRTDQRRWAGVDYSKGTSGKPYLFLASSGRMKKDPLYDTTTGYYNEMLKWGIDRPCWPAQAATSGAGDLVSVVDKYSYLYTLRNAITGHEGNPSQLMYSSENPLFDKEITTDPAGNQITVRVRSHTPEEGNDASEDPQVVGKKTIVLYRRGGTFSDGLYRRVAILDASGPTVDTVFIDNVPDDIIASNPTVEFDNDRPVAGKLPRPFTAKISGGTPLEAGTSIDGKVKLLLDIENGLEAAGPNLAELLYPGTTVRIGAGTDWEESCTVVTVDAVEGSIVVVQQMSHAVGEIVEASTRANMPCRLACVAHDSIFLAGDFYNPDTLYKSKTGRPESFPAVMSLATQAPGSIRVGTPSDPIMNLCEFNNEVISMNKSHFYHVPVTNGHMQTPTKTSAQRGLFANWAWCKGDNEIWYLAYDGIYSWSGGESTKRSEAIDPIFHGEYFNGFYPISFEGEASRDGFGFTDLDKIQLEHSGNKIYFAYIDTAGNRRRLQYHILYQRWLVDTIAPDVMLQEKDSGRFLFTTNSGGEAYLHLADSPLGSAETETTDGWTSGQGDGTAISWEVKTGWYAMGLPTLQKQYGDIILELENPGNDVTVEVFYDFDESAAHETFTITDTLGRRRYLMPINAGLAKEAWAVMFRFTGTSTQPTTLYSLTFHWLPLEEIQGGRATDWDNLGHAHDKRLQQLSLEFDVGGTPVDLDLDVMYGIGGASQALAVATFSLDSPASTDLTGPTRARRTYPINLSYPVKLVRLRANVPLQQIKKWDYHFEFLPYPPDIVRFTEWDYLGYAGEKVLTEVSIEMDTGGVECQVDVQADGLTKRTFKVKTTMDSRFVLLTMNTPGDEEIIGTQFRLALTEGVGGKAQLFKHQFHVVPEPFGVTFWDSGVQTFGSNAWRFIKQIWVQYRSCGGIIFRIYTDTKQLLQEIELPAHRHRDVERFYVDVTSVDGVYNKSKTYRFTAQSYDPCGPLYLYQDSSRVEWGLVGADVRQGYQQSPLFQPIQRTLMP